MRSFPNAVLIQSKLGLLDLLCIFEQRQSIMDALCTILCGSICRHYVSPIFIQVFLKICHLSVHVVSVLMVIFSVICGYVCKAVLIVWCAVIYVHSKAQTLSHSRLSHLSE